MNTRPVIRSAVVTGGLVLAAMIPVAGVADAQPPGPTWCTAEAQLLPSAADVGYVYGQSGAFCMQVPSLEARVETTAYRDGVRVGATSRSCSRGYFASKQRCEAPQLSITDVAGSQDFELRVTVRFTVDASQNYDRTAATTARGSY